MITVRVPKNLLLIPFFIVLVIIAMPFALFFSLIRLPFAKRRINKLPGILKNDWLPRKKYIYIGLNSGFALSDFIKDKIIRRYGNHIIWDEWDAEQNEWNESEPDSTRRVTTFWQDIGGDFDGDPMIIIAAYRPDDFTVTAENNFYQFWLHEDNIVHFNGEKLKLKGAEKKIELIVEEALDSWR